MSDKTLIKYKILLKKLGYKGYHMADLMKIKRSTYYSMTRKSAPCPKWVKMFVVIHEILERKHKKEIERIKNNIKK